MSKSPIEIDGLWMRTKPGCPLGTIQVLIRHGGRWKVAFGGDGPAPVAYAIDQEVDHCIHPLGLERIAELPGEPPPVIDPADLKAPGALRVRRHNHERARGRR